MMGRGGEALPFTLTDLYIPSRVEFPRGLRAFDRGSCENCIPIRYCLQRSVLAGAASQLYVCQSGKGSRQPSAEKHPNIDKTRPLPARPFCSDSVEREKSCSGKALSKLRRVLCVLRRRARSIHEPPPYGTHAGAPQEPPEKDRRM